MRRALAAATLLLSTTLLTACGGDGSDDGGDGGDAQPLTVEITFEGGEVTPNGERVEAEAGQPIDLVVKADEPGEIHVHSSPEQTFPYEAGTNVIKMEIARPGVVEVESHELEQVIVQLEVR